MAQIRPTATLLHRFPIWDMLAAETFLPVLMFDATRLPISLCKTVSLQLSAGTCQ